MCMGKAWDKLGQKSALNNESIVDVKVKIPENDPKTLKAKGVPKSPAK